MGFQRDGRRRGSDLSSVLSTIALATVEGQAKEETSALKNAYFFCPGAKAWIASRAEGLSTLVRSPAGWPV